MTIGEYWQGPAAGTIMNVANYVPIFRKFANLSDFYMRWLYGSREIREDLGSGKIEMLIQTYLSDREYEYTILYNSTQFEYNPIENYNMVENGDDSTTHSSTITTGAHTTTVSVAPFDSETFSAAQQSNTPSISGKDDGTNSTNHNLKRSGNIGVTTTQQMIEQERKIANIALAAKLAKEIANLISIGIYD